MEGDKQIVVKTYVENKSSKLMWLGIEPWGETFEMPPNTKWIVEFEGYEAGVPSIQMIDEGDDDIQMLLWGWTGLYSFRVVER